MSRNITRVVTAFFVLSTLLLLVPAAHADCDDPAGECVGVPCEAEGSCQSDADCVPGETCAPWEPGQNCYASQCYCENGDWTCTDDCSDRCEIGVPAVSDFGPLVLALLLLAAGTFVVLRRRRLER